MRLICQDFSTRVLLLRLSLSPNDSPIRDSAAGEESSLLNRSLAFTRAE